MKTKEAKNSQRDVADLLKVSDATIHYVKNGDRRLGSAKAKEAGIIFKCDPTIFLYGTPGQIKKAMNL